MERKALHRLLTLTLLVMALVSLNAHPAVATDRDDDKDDDHRPRIARIDAKPQGQTYGRWAAEWWQWALGIPNAVNKTRSRIRRVSIAPSDRWTMCGFWPAQ